MIVFGLAGWSGAGKTQLAEALIQHFTQMGYRIATVKHAHHKFDADIPGKDSWRHRKAGAAQVLISSQHRSALFTEYADTKEPELEALLSQLAPADLVLVEGFKSASIPKLEVWRPSVGKPILHSDDPHIFGVATDNIIDECTIPQFHLDDIASIASFLLEQLAVPKPQQQNRFGKS